MPSIPSMKLILGIGECIRSRDTGFTPLVEAPRLAEKLGVGRGACG
jgi:hypothetical protein